MSGATLRRVAGGFVGLTITVLVCASLAALYAAAKVNGSGPLANPGFALFVDLPVAAAFAVVLGMTALVVGVRVWWAGTAVFFALLPFEDLVRKYAGNDLRVVSLKYLLLVVAVFGALPMFRDRWRAAVGRAWLPTVALLGVAVLFSLPSVVQGVTLPLLGLLTRFGFLVLVGVGVAVGHDRIRLRHCYMAMSLGATAICGLGIAQRIAGPTFLNPSVVDPRLKNLSIIRQVGETVILRPAGPFVDATRFANTTTLAVVIGLCALVIAIRPFERWIGAIGVAAGFLAALASGSRTAFVVSVLAVAMTYLFASGRHQLPAIRRVAALLLVTLAGVSFLFPTVGLLARQNADVLFNTLNPFAAETSDLLQRVAGYAAAPLDPIRDGSVWGEGTGTQSIGRQYLTNTSLDESRQIESGFGAIVREWGVFGLAVWCFWSVAWFKRTVECRVSGRPDVAVIASFVFIQLFVVFWLGAGQFDTYLANVMFWFLSGIAFSAGALRYNVADPSSSVTSSPLVRRA